MNIIAALKRKDSRAAADAGLLLWRENFINFIPFFAIPLWVCAFALRRALPEKFYYLAWLIIWLLKPMFDRLALHVISIRFFEKDAGLKRLRRGLFKTLLRGLPGDLLWRRFSPLRAAMMPMRVLERNIKSGKAASERKKHLVNGGIGYCFLLTIWGIAAEAALLLGGLIFYNFICELMNISNSFLDSFAKAEIFLYTIWCANLILIETIYVCMGFSLYINSRIEVEGWDLEIIFRGFKKIAAVIVLAVCLFMPITAHADSGKDIPVDTLQTILESPDFGGWEDSWTIGLRNQPKPAETPNINPDLMKQLRNAFANFLRTFLVIAAIGLAIFLLYYFLKNRQNIIGKKNAYSVTSLQKTPEEDPKLLLEKALKFHEQGDIRLAWGYCAAAAIFSWPIYRGINFPPNATESDCVNIVISKSTDSLKANAFSRVIKNWVYFAYAGQLPPEGSFEEAVSLCKSIGVNNG